MDVDQFEIHLVAQRKTGLVGLRVAAMHMNRQGLNPSTSVLRRGWL